jgi:hypothetical protein
MSPVVVVGFGALDAALISQALYAIRDMRRSDQRSTGQPGSTPDRNLSLTRPAGFEPATSASGGRRSIH